jgi:hypothetical protein
MFRRHSDCCDSCCDSHVEVKTHAAHSSCESCCDDCGKESFGHRLRRWFKRDDCCDVCDSCSSCSSCSSGGAHGATVAPPPPAGRPAEKIGPPKEMPKGEKKATELELPSKQVQSLVPQPLAPVLATPAESKASF